MSRKWVFIILVSLAITLFVLFVVPKDNNQLSDLPAVEPVNQDSAEEPVVASEGEVVEVTVWASTVGFSPDRIEVPVGGTLLMNVFSSDVEHGVYFPEPKEVLLVVRPDNPGGIELTFDKPGEYKFIDDRVQHEITNERLEGVVVVS